MPFNPSNAPKHDSSLNEPMAPSVEQAVWLRAVIESLMDGVLVVSSQGEIIQCNNRGRQICKRLRRQPSDFYGDTGDPGFALEQAINPFPNGDHGDHGDHDRETSELAKVESLADWKVVPLPIWTVCQTILDSQRDCPERIGVPEQQIILPTTDVEDHLRLRIRAQWLTLPSTFDGDRHQKSDSQALDSFREGAYILITMEDRGQSIQHLATADKQRYRLTTRETEIWQMRLEGQSNRDIADHLFISPNTVKKHIKNIFAKRRDVLEDVG